MLQFLRKQVAAWSAKIILGVVILSFVFFWGIGDVIRGNSHNDVARIGNHTITRQDLAKEVQRSLKNLENRLKSSLTPAMIAESGLLYTSLNEMINGALLDAEANTLDITLTDQTLREELQGIPLFQDENGLFQRAKFQDALRNFGMTENQFIKTLSHDLIRKELTDHVLANPLDNPQLAPISVAKGLYQWLYSTRHVAVVDIPDAEMKIPTAPTEEELKDFYNREGNKFAESERKDITVAWLDTDAQAKKILVSAEDIEKFYRENEQNFTKPELRTVEHISVATPQEAEKIAALLQVGTPLDKAAVQASQKVKKMTLSKSHMPAVLAKAVFNTPLQERTDFITYENGHHLFKVVQITPPALATLKEVKDIIKEKIQREKFYNDANTLLKNIEDDLAGGASLKEVAAKHQMQCIDIAALSMDKTPATLEALKAIPASLHTDVMTQASQAPLHDAIPLIQLQNGMYMTLKVEKVSPRRQPALEEIKTQVSAWWKVKKCKEYAEKLANEIISSTNKGDTLEKALTGQALSLKSHSIRLDEDKQAFPPVILQEIAEMKIGDIRSVRLPDRSIILQIKSMDYVKDDQKAFKEVHQRLSTQLAIDLSEAYLNLIRKHTKVTTYPEVIQTLVPK